MSALFSPWGNQQIFDANGDPAAGWKIYAYAAGSSTPLTTYTDATGSVAQSFPIILDTLGLPISGLIWLAPGSTYKFVLTNASDVVQKTADGISGVSDSAPTISQWQSSNVDPTYISANSFAVTGDQTNELHVGRRLQFTTSVGTVYGTIATSVYTTLTTVTMTMDSGQVLDAGLSVVNLSILRADFAALPNSQAARTALGFKRGTDIASAATLNLTVAIGDIVDVTGTTGITAITLADGAEITTRFTGILTLTNGASLVNLTGANITTAAGDFATWRGYASGVVRMVDYVRADGTPLVAVALTGNQTIAGVKTFSSPIVARNAAKAWVNFDGTLAGPITPRNSYNVSSVTKNATGDYSINFISAMPNANYSVGLAGRQGSNGVNKTVLCIEASAGALSTTSVRVAMEATGPGGGGSTDNAVVCVQIFGD